MKRITDKDKQEICELVEEKKQALGSANKVAKALDVNPSTITNSLRPENWESLVSDAMWVKIGKAVGFKFSTNAWTIAENTTNAKLMLHTLKAAQENGMCMGISEKAGSGKSASIKFFQSQDPEAVFVLECDDWSKRQFLLELCQSVGIETKKSYQDINTLGKKVVDFFKGKTATCQPILILDEADKLKASALRFVITLFNKLEDECGIVLAGTENLAKEIENRRRKAVKGYDEIHSRLGRSFVQLLGATLGDVKLICEANGIENAKTIERIFSELEPIQKKYGTAYVLMVEDMRRLKRVVLREKIKNQI
jgi:hypothetical protein